MEENENVVEETTQEQTVDESKFESAGDDSVIKIDLDKPVENATREQSTDEVSVRDESETSEEIREENVEEKVEEPTGEEKPEQVQDEEPVVQEITDEEVAEEVEEVTEQVQEAVAEAEATGKPLPENIQKLVDFMNDTGGDIEDYVKLNKDYSNLDNLSLLREYYRQTKPHLTAEEVDFLMEDQFSFDEEEDEERDIKRKKLALKEQVAQAKNHLESVKGFEYNVGNKKFRYNVKNTDAVKDTQSDINNFIGKFLNESNEMSDAKGYHKSLFTAMNADAIAQHFYEQGKADALKESIAKSKNVSMNPRQEFGNVQNNSGMKVKVLGDNSSDFKFKIKKNR
jgi:hypothetical protein